MVFPKPVAVLCSGLLAFVDPAAQTLEVYRRHELGWLLVATFEGDDVERAEPFDAIELSLSGLWVR